MATPEKVKVRLVCPAGTALHAAGAGLEREGYLVRTSASLYRAVLEQRSEPCPLVVLDARGVKPEDQDFFTLLREIQSSVFILAVIPESRRELAPALLQMGADLYLVEPFYPAEVVSLLGKAVERSERTVRRDEQMADRLAGLAKFASGVAHEINNPLSVISGWLQVLMSDAKEDGPNRKTFAALQKETERIAAVVRELLAFSGQAAPNRTLIDVNRLVDETLGSVEKASSNGRVDVARRLAPELPPVLASESQLREACWHLLDRAWRSAGSGGQVEVDTACVHGDQVEVRFHDSGPAMPGELRERVFDPFYAIEQAAPPEGLGLCVSYGIARGLGGNLTVSSSDEAGTTFVMTLPAASPVGRSPASANQGYGKRNANGH